MGLRLVRELRGRSQAWVARAARVSKSQLCLYENGKQLPQLDTLSRVLAALGIGQFAFFSTLHTVDSLATAPDAPPLPGLPPTLCEDTDRVFSRIYQDLLALHRATFVQAVAPGVRARGRHRPSPAPPDAASASHSSTMRDPPFALADQPRQPQPPPTASAAPEEGT
ncbi:MAG TPA: helix-turn-helix transcriptional regulator [Thermoanaerobaculia bacterium]|nr:helix-turn-helix transcriptional regulator [Thermoanaerobaculia bacterium]